MYTVEYLGEAAVVFTTTEVHALFLSGRVATAVTLCVLGREVSEDDLTCSQATCNLKLI